ncbi:hypothetical protein ACWF9G_11640 [Nocardia sp. NPDC055029]|uniref:hypothetical protein n=1 Tax=Nocardia sp. NPDC060259 TaxID=3347088 RepID=UPI00366835E2
MTQIAAPPIATAAAINHPIGAADVLACTAQRNPNTEPMKDRQKARTGFSQPLPKCSMCST